jgi:uncharacterized protein (DUF305 family)
MQITIDKKSGIFISVIAVLLIVIVFLAFNPGRDADGPHSGKHDMGMHEGNQNISGSDLMFLQMMIPHHEQAVEMSDLALSKSKNAEILKLAQQIRDAQSAEIISMKSWLPSSYVGPPVHEMNHGMGGMMSDTEMSALKAATGSSFDALFIQGMITHHEGALHMVMMIQDSNDKKLRALHDNIITTQTAEIEWMKKIKL